LIVDLEEGDIGDEGVHYISNNHSIKQFYHIDLSIFMF